MATYPAAQWQYFSPVGSLASTFLASQPLTIQFPFHGTMDVPSAPSPSPRPPFKPSHQGSGIAIPLPSDTVTQGDWTSVYGSYGFVLCGTGGALPAGDLRGGSGWLNGMPAAFYTGDRSERGRVWTASKETDRRVLMDPGVTRRRVAALWDDHGEVLALGKGPNLLVDVEMPGGIYILSLYFYESDWPQNRRYEVLLRERTWRMGSNPERKLGRVFCRSEAADFFNGRYVRFLARGHRYQIEIQRLQSPNAILSGIFLDRLSSLSLLEKETADRPEMKALVSQIRAAYGKFPVDFLHVAKAAETALSQMGQKREGGATSHAKLLTYFASLLHPERRQAILGLLQDYAIARTNEMGPEAASAWFRDRIAGLLAEDDDQQAAALGQALLNIAEKRSNVLSDQGYLAMARLFWRRRGIPPGGQQWAEGASQPRSLTGRQFFLRYLDRSTAGLSGKEKAAFLRGKRSEWLTKTTPALLPSQYRPGTFGWLVAPIITEEIAKCVGQKGLTVEDRFIQAHFIADKEEARNQVLALLKVAGTPEELRVDLLGFCLEYSRRLSDFTTVRRVAVELVSRHGESKYAKTYLGWHFWRFFDRLRSGIAALEERARIGRALLSELEKAAPAGSTMSKAIGRLKQRFEEKVTQRGLPSPSGAAQ